MSVKIRRALISVTDKSELEPIAKTLQDLDVEIISTGGTAAYLEQKGIKITPIEKISGSPEAFAGRMKSISFNVMSGILFRRDDESDKTEACALGVKAIDLVICNLYAFEKKQQEGLVFEELIEHIDIGGPTLIRAAAKNHCYVGIATDPSQYANIISELEESNGCLGQKLLKDLASAAFSLTAHYDSAIAAAFTGGGVRQLRYGENPQQSASLHLDGTGFSLVEQLGGKEMSYNNYLDADAAIKTVVDLKKVSNDNAAVIVKHLNPCGASVNKKSDLALQDAWAGDPVSSFGGIVAITGECDLACATFLSNKFVEIIVAESFGPEALSLLSKKKNLRLLAVDYQLMEDKGVNKRSILGGVLEQSIDLYSDEEFENPTEAAMEADELARFGVVMAKNLKSNAIAIVGKSNHGLMMMGAGMGNPNRILSVEQAVLKAQQNGFKDLSNAVLVSDGFFPFADSVDKACEFGIRKIVQPGGSIRDGEVVDRCNHYGVAMIITGKRHFNH